MNDDLPLSIGGELGKSLAATLQHVELIHQRERKLTAAREAALDQLSHRIGAAVRSGEIDDAQLVAIWEQIRDSAVPGRQKFWDKNVPTKWLRLKYRKNQIPNGPEGTWVGENPCVPTDPAPGVGVSVVYVLFDDQNEPCYVGSTGNFRPRLKAHIQSGKQFVRWQAHPCRDREHAYELEVRLLGERKPRLNRRVGR